MDCEKCLEQGAFTMVFLATLGVFLHFTFFSKNEMYILFKSNFEDLSSLLAVREYLPVVAHGHGSDKIFHD